MKLRMRVKTDYVENDPPETPRRKTIGLELVPSDDGDDNADVAASSGQLVLHGCQAAGWKPFVDGGDFYVTVEPAPAVKPAEAPTEKPAA